MERKIKSIKSKPKRKQDQMKTYLDCIPCFFKQALEAARTAGAGTKTPKKVLDELTGS